MGFLSRKRQDSLDLDTFERLMRRLVELESAVRRLETEWSDTKDQVRRSYLRLEKATQRMEAKSKGSDGVQPTDHEELEPEFGLTKQAALARAFNRRSQ